jgi:radical SAM protein (TIGR01212 family)
MQKYPQWQGLPYYSIGQFYKDRFGSKVYKIPVSTAQSCPNRDGIKGMKTCIFCDEWGSAAYPELREQALRYQIAMAKERVQKRTNANKFMVYFQAYTNTFTKTATLRRQFEIASEFNEVLGFVVGTRPDCLSDAVFSLWDEFSKTKFIAVELGVQSLNNKQLKWMERGHSAEKSLEAIERIKTKTDVDLGVHLMFGLPGETDQQIVETAKTLSALPVDNVKLHNLHVLKNTPLEKIYRQGDFEPIGQEAYADRVILFLQHLDPRIAVHRLAALSKRQEELIAPQWVGKKMEVYQYIVDRFKEKQAFQGQHVI